MPPLPLAAVVAAQIIFRILVATITVITVIMMAAIANVVTEQVALSVVAKFVLKVCATA